MNIFAKAVYVLILTSSAFITAYADIEKFPVRESPKPVTTQGIPHIQIDVEAVHELSKNLLLQVSMLEGVDLRGTIVGRSGSTGFWLKEDVKVARPDAIVRGREFAHLHPDGSLHASLPSELADKAIEAGWAVHHPWAGKKRGLEGFVMLYSPQTEDEMDVVFQLVEESYLFITGQ